MQATKIQIQTRRPSGPNDPGEIAIGHYVFRDGIVTLTCQAGEPLPGGYNTELGDGEVPAIVARALLRQMRDVNRRGRGFNRDISRSSRGVV
jgi:hypothetical protein